jgi:hypothetical protein
MIDENLNEEFEEGPEFQDITTELAVIAFASTAAPFIHKEALFSDENHEVLRDKNGNMIYKMNYDAEKHRNFHKNLLLNYDCFVSELEAETTAVNNQLSKAEKINDDSNELGELVE